MNPIFSRRYKQGSRPNILPTNRRQNYARSSSSAGNSSSSSSLSGSLASVSLGGSIDEVTPEEKDDKPPIQVKARKVRQKASPGDEGRNASDMAQQLLASKQNMLAQMSLTAHENRQRTKQKSPEGMRHSISTEGFVMTSRIGKSPTANDISDMTLCDVEDEMDRPFVPTPASSIPRISRPNLNQRISKEPLDLRTWKELKKIVTGTGNFQDGWVNQGFTFDKKIPFGLVQKKGGPCGVLAVVQSLLLRNLLFGSPFKDLNDKSNELKDEEVKEFLKEDNQEVAESIRGKRVECLVDAVAEIIWTCANQNEDLTKDKTSIIMLSDCRIQAETIRVSGRDELRHFLQSSIHRFDCIALVYSAVLTRGISGVRDDMDFENCSLVGQHGYCSQELISLLTIGKAISNTFDNEIELDGKILKGIKSQCDIGMLSLFEHYDSIKIGGYLKNPKFPLWMVCSESHYSVLFSAEEEVGGDKFDLFYYDGLGRMENVIRLSINLTGTHRPSLQKGKLGGDLVPPLEKCIRTKWPNASVDWNDNEPIL